jgi:acyl-CoA synthetase (AMP-forming)/AMP-acid ligase II
MTDSTPVDSGTETDTVAGLLSPQSRGPALLTAGGDIMSHPELRVAVDRLGDQLRHLGMGPEDRMAIVLPNGPEMALVLLAVMSVGWAAPLNPKYREEEFRFYLEDLRPSAIITADGEGSPALVAAPPGTVVVEGRGGGLFPELIATGARTGAPGSARPTPGDGALVLHTSGTTSRPKIVPLRQRHLAHSARNIARSLELSERDRSLNVMPLFHIHGIMAGLLAPLSAGGSVVCTPGFDAFKFHRWVDELGPTYYSAVPTMHQMVLARAPAPRPTTLRLVRSSSASLPTPVLEDLGSLFDVPVVEAYGMTEASHQMTCNPLPPGVAKPGSVGVPAGIEVAVLDAASRPLAVGQRGEVAIKGATVIDGYENNPGANQSAFTAGWFRTGDEGAFDQDGYLFLTGRLKEQINRGGEKISPIEVDEVLLRHPAVAQAVTFAVPHDKLGEDVAAVVVLREGEQATDAELRGYVGEYLAAFKVPRRVVLVAEIPTGSTGKVQRIGLAEKLGL